VIQFPRVRYCLEPPDWGAIRQPATPTFATPPTLRSAWPRLVGLAAARANVIFDARRAGADLRASLGFLVWLETARCFGVQELEGDDQITYALNRHLSAAAPSPPGTHGGVTAVVIAKNEEATLPDALRSVQELADELVVVVDDESTDATAEIARAMGARVLIRALRGNFAEQRNAGLAAVGTDWVVSIDADERIEPELLPMFRQLMAWPQADSVFVPVLNLIAERGEDPVHWPDVKVRVFRSRLRFQGAVHERLEGWRRPMFTPLSGPFIRHEKTLLTQHRSTLLYDEIDPRRPYTREEIASVKDELTRLEREE
jgi:Glycosyl transferase family 2